MVFGDCTLEELDELFNLKPLNQLPALVDWLNEPCEISEKERDYLSNLQLYLQDNVLHWNEQELAMHFIGPMFALVQFGYDHKFNLFAERAFSGTVEGIAMNGAPDGMIATGYRQPDKPYFCFQEYQQDPPFIPPDSGGTEGGNGDPAGQALAAMLVAQELNEHRFPIYGCYVRGRHWHFMALQGKEYALSDSYVATQEHIFDILRILKVLKQMIIDRVIADEAAKVG